MAHVDIRAHIVITFVSVLLPPILILFLGCDQF
jgi:hypothetical protein